MNQHEAANAVQHALEKCPTRLAYAKHLVRFQGLRVSNKDEIREQIVEIKKACEAAIKAIEEVEFTP